MTEGVLLFPGQGSQFVGMGKYLLENFPSSLSFFEKANDVLGFDITQIMKEGTATDLQQTKVTQSAILIHSMIALDLLPKGFKITAAAGLSLGEFSALYAAGVLQFEDALRLVDVRATAMQKACQETPSTMAAVMGLDDSKIVSICEEINNNEDIVVPANFNCQGQVVISGNISGVEKAKEVLLKAGAKRVMTLPVGGAFHSPLMQSAQEALEQIINQTKFEKPKFPVYHNVTAKASSDIGEIRANLIKQLTGPVMWTQTIQQMEQDGLKNFVEVGPGKVLQVLVQKISPNAQISHWESLVNK